MLKLIRHIQEYCGQYDFNSDRLAVAFDWVADAYADQRIDLDFSLRVVQKMLSFRPDEDTLIAVLLQDLYALSLIKDEDVKEVFGTGVLSLLLHLKRIFSLNYDPSLKMTHKEVLRKMFLTMAKDIRVIVVWLIVRLQQFEDQDLFVQSANNPSEVAALRRFADDTMNIFVPIAGRLGIFRLKTSLEDLAFKYLEPENFKFITDEIDKYGKERAGLIEAVVTDLKEFFRDNGVEANVFGRVKTVYSVYKKLKRKSLNSLDQIFDFFAIRVILPDGASVDDLYAVLGLIHGHFKPISNRFKDYVSVPKTNGYRSLHTVVVGIIDSYPDQYVEVQIRSESMHREAEFGVASHWLYKDMKGSTNEDRLRAKVDWIKGLSTIGDLFAADSDFMQSVSLDLFEDRIFVLTPRGDVIDLPARAVPLDFAYAVHTAVGNHCAMAKVNGKLVSLDDELSNGDVVEIVTRKDVYPKMQWLSKVRTNFAASRIKAYFNELNKEVNLKQGKRMINDLLDRFGKPNLTHNLDVLKDYDGRILTFSQRQNLLEEVGRGVRSGMEVVRKAYDDGSLREVSSVERVFKTVKVDEGLNESEVLVGGQAGLPVKMAACCNPQVGEAILGYVTRGNKITIHSNVCRLLDSLDVSRVLFASWYRRSENENQGKLELRLKVSTRLGMLRDLATVIEERGFEILDMKIESLEEGVSYDYFTLNDRGEVYLELLMKEFLEIEGVFNVLKL